MFHRAEKNLYRIIAPLIILLLVFLAVACQKEQFGQEKRKSRIVPVLKSVQTKAQDGLLTADTMPVEPLSERVVASVDGFDLIETVYDLNALPYGSIASAGGFTISGSDPETKGTVVTSSNISPFSMDVYAEGQWHDNTLESGAQGSLGMPNSAGLYFSAECSGSNTAGWSLTYKDGPARVGTSGELYWINDVPMTFWSWNVVKPVWNPSGSNATFNYTVDSDVSKQKDPVFAYSREQRKYHDDGADYGKLESESSGSGASDDEVNVWFFHALSAVQFIKNSSLTASDYRISGIELQNVKNSTTCTISVDNSTVAAKNNPNISFAHDVSGSTKVNFSQTYDVNDASLDEPTDAATNGRFKPTDGKTFIMIPQTLGADAKLKVTFTNTTTGNSETTSPVFNLDGSWEAGKYYVYKIDLNGVVTVNIGETCTATAKSDVKFQNTSSLNEYIRAAVVANWYDASGNIVAAWDKTHDGDITLGSGWTSGTDGFYYHTASVATKEYTSKLFDSFTKPTAAPVTGAHFEMTILVQAVGSDGMTSCTAAFTN